MDAQMTGGAPPLAGDVSMDDADAMLGFGHDAFLDADDLNGLLPLDVDLDGLHHGTAEGIAAVAAAGNNLTNTATQSIQPSVEDTGDGHDAAAAEALTGPGAGPLPASFGVQLPPNAGSTLTEFTKRRNWSQRVIEELKDFLHVLTPDGRIIYASPSTRSLTGHEPNNLVGEFISDYIHPDDSAMFVREFNESIASGNPLRFYYRFRKPDGQYTIFESHGHPHIASDPGAFTSDNNAPLCRGFFMMARPYPTKNASLLDSFLEHKIENERLKKRIADLKREEQEDMEEQQRQWNTRQMDLSATPTGAHGDHGANLRSTSSDSPHNFDGMPPPAKPGTSNLALTRQNLSDALAASRPDSINDKMARYEGVSHLETIEMLTGLRYRDGERSKGISTGAASPTLLRGDQGIAISADKDRFGRNYSGSPYGDVMSDRDKKKKMKVADEYVCTDCGTLDSPEWRKGPTGPKTLCNACGLRWAKKEKKKSGGNDALSSNNTPLNNAGTTTSTTPTAKSNGGNGQGGNGQGGANIQTGHNQGPNAATTAAQGMIMPGQTMTGSGPPLMPQGMQYMGLNPSMQGAIPNNLAMPPNQMQ